MPDVSSESEPSQGQQEDEDADDAEDEDGADEDRQPKLKVCGGVCQFLIDPDVSSEDEMSTAKKKKNSPSTEVAEVAQAKQDEAAKKKDKIKALTEMSRNLDRLDQRETLQLLMKHGLTIDEAKEYTQLGTSFDIRQLREEEKSILENNFPAQVYAFRKLREKLLMSDDPGRIYKEIGDKSVGKLPAEGFKPPNHLETEKARLEKIQRKFQNEDRRTKSGMVKNALQTISDEQLRAIRRREYYNRRVKADFAPKLELDELKEIEDLEDSSPLSPFGRQRIRLAKDRKKKLLQDELQKKRLEHMPDWNKHINLPETKGKYTKQSDRTLKAQEEYDNQRSKSTMVYRGRYDQDLKQSVEQGAFDDENPVPRLQLPNLNRKRKR